MERKLAPESEILRKVACLERRRYSPETEDVKSKPVVREENSCVAKKAESVVDNGTYTRGFVVLYFAIKLA
jgi:hypothetical protein